MDVYTVAYLRDQIRAYKQQYCGPPYSKLRKADLYRVAVDLGLISKSNDKPVTHSLSLIQQRQPHSHTLNNMQLAFAKKTLGTELFNYLQKTRGIVVDISKNTKQSKAHRMKILEYIDDMLSNPRKYKTRRVTDIKASLKEDVDQLYVMW